MTKQMEMVQQLMKFCEEQYQSDGCTNCEFFSKAGSFGGWGGNCKIKYPASTWDIKETGEE